MVRELHILAHVYKKAVPDTGIAFFNICYQLKISIFKDGIIQLPLIFSDRPQSGSGSTQVKGDTNCIKEPVN
jgi:hypothetical protein